MNSDSEHARIFEKIQLYPEPASWDEETRAHLAQCARCRAAAESFQILRERLPRLESSRASAPPSLRLGLGEALAGAVAGAEHEALGRTRRRTGQGWVARASWRWRWLVPSSTLAAGILLGFALANWSPSHSSPSSGGEVSATVLDYLQDVTHDGFLIAQLQRPLELLSHDSHEVSTWLDQGLPFSPALGEAPPGWQLQGARIWHTVSRLSALAEYRDGQGAVVLLFAVPAAQIDFTRAKKHQSQQGPLYEGQSWGYQGLAWRDGDLAWSAVSTLTTAALLDWLSAYRAHP